VRIAFAVHQQESVVLTLVLREGEEVPRVGREDRKAMGSRVLDQPPTRLEV